MSDTLQDLVKKIELNNQVVNHCEKNPNEGVMYNYSSCSVESDKTIIKGELSNPKTQTRKANITVFDAKTGQIRGMT